jgi:LuxR family transcriptional regulator, maltose regulon positive regulatory protein
MAADRGAAHAKPRLPQRFLESRAVSRSHLSPAMNASTPKPEALASHWSTIARTKLTRPRLRRDVVERAPLLRALRMFALERRLTLVCAPAGYGKSTLLAQLCESLGDAAQSVWLALDVDDNDSNRLFLSLLAALRDVELEWPVDPAALVGQLDAGAAGARAALAGLVNALCSYEGERLLVVLDDLHRVTDASALALLDEIVGLLPPEVGFVIGTRIEPELSLARWRAGGELGELRMADLQFDEADAQAFARSRGLADAGEFAREALPLTQGWAAGLQLVAGASAVAKAGPETARTRRHLFDYFAREVLAGLDPELRDFVLQTAVLPELTPALCRAVSGRADAHALLERLYRRNLFVSALDEALPALRLHDLFRDFLLAELERAAPHSLPELHARAAHAETLPQRAVAHWLQARRWGDALAAILECAEALLAEGGHATLARWLEQLPADVRRLPEAHHVVGLCAWWGWNWLTAREHLERACAGYRGAGRQRHYVAALGLLGACCNALGELEAAALVLQEADALPLEARERVPFDSLHAWNALAGGRWPETSAWLQTMAEHVARAPSTVYPSVADMAHGHLVGLPGALPELHRLRALCRELRQREVTHWSSAVVAQGAWIEFWRGDREAAQAALAQQRELQQRLPAALILVLSSLHLHAFHLALHGRHAEAARELHEALQTLETPEGRGLKVGWRRSYLHALARLHWMAQDAPALQALLPELLQPRSAAEWPVLDMGAALARGRHALLCGQLALAEQALLEAVQQHERLRLPSFIGDPRVALALLHQQRGDAAAARASLQPVLDEALRDDAIGSLLIEPREPLHRLLGLLPEDHRQHPPMQALLRRLTLWSAAEASPTAAQASDAAHWRGVTEREREVLALMARGLSNKLIARELDVSLHTVKRHVANVLGKLEVGSRGQAALWYSARIAERV